MLKKTVILTLTISAIALHALTEPIYAQISEFKMTATDAAAGDRFGHSVSIDGDYAIVGAIWEDEGGFRAGAAYIYFRAGQTWTEQSKLTATGANWFGVSVSISGDYAIVGNLGKPAHIFIRSGVTWSEQAQLTVSGANTQFGRSVSIDGDYAIVGAWGDDDGGTDAGAAHIFIRSGTTWTEQA